MIYAILVENDRGLRKEIVSYLKSLIGDIEIFEYDKATDVPKEFSEKISYVISDYNLENWRNGLEWLKSAVKNFKPFKSILITGEGNEMLKKQAAINEIIYLEKSTGFLQILADELGGY